MVAQANEANDATDETPAKVAPLRALTGVWVSFLRRCADEK